MADMKQWIIPPEIGDRTRAAIYTRVSSPQQVKNTSLASQDETCSEFAEYAGLDVVGTWTDAGKSGTLSECENLRRLLDALDNGIAQVLLVKYIDRLNRDIEDLEVIRKRLDACGAVLVSVSMCQVGAAEHGFHNHLQSRFVDFTKPFAALVDAIDAWAAATMQELPQSVRDALDEAEWQLMGMHIRTRNSK